MKHISEWPAVVRVPVGLVWAIFALGILIVGMLAIAVVEILLRFPSRRI